MPIIIHPADCTVIYQCSIDVQIIFYFQLKREKGVKRENMSVTCKDLIEYVMEQQKVKQLRSISFLERDVTYHSTKHVCSLFISPQEDFLVGGAKDKENPFPSPHPCKIF